MVWARMLAHITGTVDQELLLRNEYLAAENPYGKKIDRLEKARLAASTSLFGLPSPRPR